MIVLSLKLDTINILRHGMVRPGGAWHGKAWFMDTLSLKLSVSNL